MEAEYRFHVVMFVKMIILEIVLIIIIVSKIKKEREYIRKSQKMKAVIRKADKDMSYSKYKSHKFVVKAENGYVYNVCSPSLKAKALIEGDTVEIYVPENNSGHYEDDDYEAIFAEGTGGISRLSHEEKLRLNDYLDRRIQEGMKSFNNRGGKFERVRFVFDGGGEKSGIIVMSGVAAVIAFTIISFLVLRIWAMIIFE